RFDERRKIIRQGGKRQLVHETVAFVIPREARKLEEKQAGGEARQKHWKSFHVMEIDSAHFNERAKKRNTRNEIARAGVRQSCRVMLESRGEHHLGRAMR